MVEALWLVVELVVEPAETLSREGCPTMRAADRASPWWYGAGLLAMVLVGDGVLPVRPAANANRWSLVLKIR
jgi:hypothetical protein